MFSRSVLLVLLVLACLQSFTMAQNNGPKKCCFSYQTRPIPIKYIAGYEETEFQCSKPGVIFTLNDSRQVCADPRVDWVKSNMNIIDQRPRA
ncbi:hypothetical protein KOW79_006848 [Hemibagrus wyckioides]|uniref:C-C motif chemokine n=1 Tax=Hemibagrus wyckioides TaxID=337641 RepID=A0A9D3NWM6_9TELE|nr:C-C motif chemokine 3-like [Hemibagrus wyckioides]XP_058251275.1 C-C motif chemokine 3-like [Hemibagrus wyckioides]KAG7330626.1 hypothetical protein KOW79_006848 [Hemibagrus wyckioides]